MLKKLLPPLSVLVAAYCDLQALAAGLADANAMLFWLWHLAGIVFSVVGLLFWLPASYRATRWSLLAWVIGFCAPLPLAGLLFMTGFCAILSSRRPDRSDTEYIIGERQILTLIKEEDVPKATPRSMLEILGGRDGELRRRAILALRSIEPKKALPVLQKATQDSDEQVRLLAQTQFNKIVAGLEIAIKRMEGLLSRSDRPPEKLVRLAEQYHEIVYLGISSSETEVIYLERASELLREVLEKQPDHQPARFLLLKCYIKNQKVPEARQCLEHLRKQGFQSEFLFPWEADLCFQERDWAAVGRVLNQARTKAVDARVKGLAELWLSPAEKA